MYEASKAKEVDIEMSQEVQIRSSVSKEGNLIVLITRYGRHIYLTEDEARMIRFELTKAIRKVRRKK